MALYKFIRTLGNKRAGVTYPLPVAAGQMLVIKGYAEMVDHDANPLEGQKEPAKRGRKTKK